MNAPNGQKTYTERRIELGQDINNAWAIVTKRYDGSESLHTLFEETFPLVREISKKAREGQE